MTVWKIGPPRFHKKKKNERREELNKDIRFAKGFIEIFRKEPESLTYSVDIQIPPEKVFWVYFVGPNPFSTGVWISRISRD